MLLSWQEWGWYGRCKGMMGVNGIKDEARDLPGPGRCRPLPDDFPFLFHDTIGMGSEGQCVLQSWASMGSVAQGARGGSDHMVCRGGPGSISLPAA